MSSHKSILFLVVALVLSIQSCTTGGSSSSPDVGIMAGTIVAMTFQAATASASQKSNAATPRPSVTPTTKPALFINNNIQCRTGTNTNFRIIASFASGTTVEIVGKNTAASAWLVKVPNSTETCWVMALDGSPGGSYESLPEVTPLPSSQKPPTIPQNISYPFLCSYAHDIVYTVKVDLSWYDPGQDANGYHVYRFDTPIADVPANITSYEDTTDVQIGTQLKYSVEAYNDVGVSPRQTITINSICKNKLNP